MAFDPYNQGYGTDPRGQALNMIGYQQRRYEDQIDPVIDEFAFNYGRGAEANYGDYTDIMNQYRAIAQGGGVVGGGGGGGGGDFSYGAESYTPELIKYNDPFNSYGGYEEFSKTGGYSRDDIQNMRARGVSPIRAAYANAEREVARQRSLQGGYAPNAFALQGRMAREQGQLGADAVQSVEAGLAEARNKGRLSGLTGMTDIEKQRLAGDLDVQKYNADALTTANKANVGARNAAAAGSASNNASAAAASRADQLNALRGMTTLYSATPGMAQLFGDQLLSSIGQSGTQAQNTITNTNNAGKSPGQFEQTTGRINSAIDTGTKIANIVGTGVNAYNQYKQEKKKPIGGTTVGTASGPDYAAIGAMGG